MVETRTPRLGLPQWSSGSQDSPSREDFNEAFLNLENRAGRWEEGTVANRPAPDVPGRYYTDTDTGTIYRDTGTAWTVVGTPTNELRITKTGGANPAITADVPAGQTGDAFRSIHNNKIRFRVDAAGDLTASSVRFFQSDTAPPASNLASTVGIIPKSASAAGLTIWGNPAQFGNLIEGKIAAGADVYRVTPSGDALANARASVGSMSPADSQLFIAGSQETRPVILARSSNIALNNGPVIVAENRDGTAQLFRVDGTGRAALGNRNSPANVAGDLLAINTNQTGTNNGTSPIGNGRIAFRNLQNGYGVAGLDVQQEPGDGPSAASVGIFAGLASGDNGQSPERLRLGLTGEKIGARFTASAPDWRPLVVRGAPSQSAPLLSLLRDDGTPVATIAANGDITANKVTTASTDPSVLAGPLTSAGVVQGTALRAIQGAAADAGVLSQIRKNATSGAHFQAQDENGVVRARITREGTLEIGNDNSAVAAGAVLLTMRGQQYRQNGRKLQSYDADSGRWGSFESAFAAEYYATTSQAVANNWVAINWGGEQNDTENAYDQSGSMVFAPFTGWYDVRALSHVNMNFTGSGSATFRINNVLEMKYRRDFPRAFGFDVCTLSLNDLVYLNRGDRLEFMVAIDSFWFGVNTLNSGNYRSRMSIRFAGNA